MKHLELKCNIFLTIQVPSLAPKTSKDRSFERSFFFAFDKVFQANRILKNGLFPMLFWNWLYLKGVFSPAWYSFSYEIQSQILIWKSGAKWERVPKNQIIIHKSRPYFPWLAIRSVLFIRNFARNCSYELKLYTIPLD